MSLSRLRSQLEYNFSVSDLNIGEIDRWSEYEFVYLLQNYPPIFIRPYKVPISKNYEKIMIKLVVLSIALVRMSIILPVLGGITRI
jgi:hypothetical protein